MSTTTTSTTPSTFTNLVTLLPTGTYLAFSTIVPISTNNGNCNETHKIVTGFVVVLFTFTCAFTCFTDSFSADNGAVWYGLVTTKGLWNPFFARSGLPDVTGWTYTGGGTKDTLKLSDFYIATLSVVSFLTLTFLSADLAYCYYPDLNRTVLKSIPLPVNFFIGILLAFAPPSRHSVGFSFSKKTSASSASSSVALTTAKSTA